MLGTIMVYCSRVKRGDSGEKYRAKNMMHKEAGETLK
jgi:hypothetical protein